MRQIYLDNNATTQCAPEVLDAMLPFFVNDFGNPSSPHTLGRRAANAIEFARQQVADCLECDSSEIVFTGSATEANNLVLLGISRSNFSRNKIVTSTIEHRSVLAPLEFLELNGFRVVTIPVNSDGLVDISAAEDAIDDSTLLVSIQAANNEIGTLQPVRDIASIAHEHGAMLHCDAAQLLGKLPFSIPNLDVDFATFSTHKFYGPKGVGFFFASKKSRRHLVPVLLGGGQERGSRPGTENIPGAVGTGEACRICRSLVSCDAERIGQLRMDLEENIRKSVPDVRIIAKHSPRLPGTTTLTFPGVEADVLLPRVPELCIGIGSACSSGSYGVSHVLRATGLDDDAARSSIRISIGRQNTSTEIAIASKLLSEAIHEIRDETTV